MMKRGVFFGVFLVLVVLAGCVQPWPEQEPWELRINTPYVVDVPEVVHTPFMPATVNPQIPRYTPTPDPPRVMPTLRSEEEYYTVQYNDSLSQIARQYGVDLNALARANNIANPNLLSVGQGLTIPASDLSMHPSDFKIIPDSELVYGPGSIGFDIADFLNYFDGRLAQYENVDDVILRVAQDYSVNPRLLLVLLEYRTGWLTGHQITPEQATEEPQEMDAWKSGLFTLLSNMANRLNWGYYLWRANALSYFILTDGTYLPVDATINAGTASVQYWASMVFGKDDWRKAVAEDGIFSLYEDYFGYPFHLGVDPILPESLVQPEFMLPFQPGYAWSYTGGPHSAWGDGTAWAALDFSPSGTRGCGASAEYVTAVADGPILRAEDGAVIQDLDGDGYEQTGWIVLYMHISTWERVEAGDFVKAGEIIGHASCEGGISTGTHLHIARRYNGEWISADGPLPFVMDGYVARSSGVQYDGFLERNGAYIEAWYIFRPESVVTR